jgi:potassium-transporting ATPase KdpC subunit
MSLLLANLRPAISMIAVMTLLLGLGYPLAMTGLGQSLFPAQANGSLLERDGTVVGSVLVGQSFTDPRYLQGRPSAVDYDAASSGARRRRCAFRDRPSAALAPGSAGGGRR